MAQQEMDGVFCKVRAEILKAGEFGVVRGGKKETQCPGV
jgi:hypothetical protein